MKDHLDARPDNAPCPRRARTAWRVGRRLFGFVPSRGGLSLSGLIYLGCFVSTATAQRTVDLELRPADQVVSVGDLVEIGLYAVSSDGDDLSFLSLQAILVWDATRLEFQSLRDVCSPPPCPADGYDWPTAGLFDDSLGDGLNVSLTDGDMVYVAFGPFFPGDPRPVATAAGLHVVGVQFRAVASGAAPVSIVAARGSHTRTIVDNAGVNVLGSIGPAVTVRSVVCVTPEVLAIGGRYLRIDPQGGTDPIAIRVFGESGDPDVECVDGYVQPDGRLGAQPVMRTPGNWGSIFLSGPDVIPDAVYSVRAECAPDIPETLASPFVDERTWRWGDVNGDDDVEVGDVSLVFDGAQGIFAPNVTVENLDIAPCVPDHIIDAQDVARVLNAQGGTAYPCFTPCEAGPSPETLGDFTDCLSGPFVIAPVECVRFDITGEAHVDLADFAVLEPDFATP